MRVRARTHTLNIDKFLCRPYTELNSVRGDGVRGLKAGTRKQWSGLGFSKDNGKVTAGVGVGAGPSVNRDSVKLWVPMLLMLQAPTDFSKSMVTQAALINLSGTRTNARVCVCVCARKEREI